MFNKKLKNQVASQQQTITSMIESMNVQAHKLQNLERMFEIKIHDLKEAYGRLQSSHTALENKVKLMDGTLISLAKSELKRKYGTDNIDDIMGKVVGDMLDGLRNKGVGKPIKKASKKGKK